MKKLIIETSKGTKTYQLSPDARGFDVYRVTTGFLSDSRKYVGHGSSLENAVAIARMDVGESIIRGTKLKD
jgi:hypothetical protein